MRTKEARRTTGGAGPHFVNARHCVFDPSPAHLGAGHCPTERHLFGGIGRVEAAAGAETQ